MVINTAPGGGRTGKSLPFIPMAIVLGAVLALSGCASTGEKAAATEANPVDPYENFNRKVFAFNDKVDNYVAEPVANAYKWVTPEFMQTSVANFFSNLKNINVVLNDLLQAKFQQGAADTGRFLINTTAGVGGLFDVAKHAGLEQNDEDFEQTLAVWGVPSGSYLVLPFLGPSTARGIPGSVFDAAANPATYLGGIGVPVSMVSMVNARANAEGALKFIDEAALDPYVFTRESFLQWRQNLATDGKSETANDLSGLEEDLLDEPAKSSDTAKPGAKPAAERPKAGADKAAAPEVQGAVSEEPVAQPAAVKVAADTPALVDAAPRAPGGGSVQGASYLDAQRKYERARFEYKLLSSQETQRKAHKAK